MTIVGAQQSEDRLKLVFLDHEKIAKISNYDFPLINTVTIVDQNMTGFLVDDRSSYNIL